MKDKQYQIYIDNGSKDLSKYLLVGTIMVDNKPVEIELTPICQGCGDAVNCNGCPKPECMEEWKNWTSGQMKN